MKTVTKVLLGAGALVAGVYVYKRLTTPAKPKTLGGALGDLFDSGRNLFDIVTKKTDVTQSPVSGIAPDDSPFASSAQRTSGLSLQPTNIQTSFTKALGGTVDSDPFNPLITVS
jgi:hypothetical protein